MSKTKVHILDPDDIVQDSQRTREADEHYFSELIREKCPGEVLELFIEKHIPKASLIAKVNNPNVTQAIFTIDNYR